MEIEEKTGCASAERCQWSRPRPWAPAPRIQWSSAPLGQSRCCPLAEQMKILREFVFCFMKKEPGQRDTTACEVLPERAPGSQQESRLSPEPLETFIDSSSLWGAGPLGRPQRPWWLLSAEYFHPEIDFPGSDIKETFKSEKSPVSMSQSVSLWSILEMLTHMKRNERQSSAAQCRERRGRKRCFGACHRVDKAVHKVSTGLARTGG